jgi:kinesin family member C2/C3
MVLVGAKEISITEESMAPISAENSEISPFSIEEIIETGMKNRSVGGTNANAQSSRSHSIVTFTLKFLNGSSGKFLTSKINIIDLAGSERTGETNA